MAMYAPDAMFACTVRIIELDFVYYVGTEYIVLITYDSKEKM